jgi:hypothetical protein
MSYDLDLYLAKRTDLMAPDALVSVDPPARIDSDDIPQSYAPLIGRRRWLIRIHIQGTPDANTLAGFET